MERSYNTSLSKKTIAIFWRATIRYKLNFYTLLISRPIYLFSTYVGNVYLTGLAVDKLRTGDNFDLWADFGGIIIGLILFAIAQIFFEYLSVRNIWTLEAKVMRDLGEMAYGKLINESAEFHANRFSGSLVSQTNKFIGAYDRLAEVLHWQVYSFFLNGLFTIIVLGPRLPIYTLVLCILLMIFFIVSVGLNKRGKLLNAKIADAENRLTGQLADSVGNILAVKSFGEEVGEKKRFRKLQDRVLNTNMETRRYNQRKDFIINIPVTSATILAVVFSIYAANKNIAPLSTILLATVMTRDLFMRAREFNVNSQRNIAKAFGDSYEMTAILQTEPKVNDSQASQSLDITNSEVIFEDVSFGYKDDGYEGLFDRLNLKVRPGEKIGLVGPSGGGKSTITKLLLRFMDIQSGKISIDQTDISKVKQSDLRRAIAYVPQEPLLFHRSLADNIRYGKTDASLEEVKRVAKLAHADEFIENLPDAYETLVGERGVKLSGGQKQRIAIARAILKDAPILVLDEATSALDSESEAAIQSALANLMQNKTTMVIAHRLSTIQKMDRIIVLDKGKIVEEGTHKNLVNKKDGLYARLWSHQSGGFIVED
jgi:ATP-binding cassette subfamily B protein